MSVVEHGAGSAGDVRAWGDVGGHFGAPRLEISHARR
jgi:hypothetical protein